MLKGGLCLNRTLLSDSVFRGCHVTRIQLEVRPLIRNSGLLSLYVPVDDHNSCRVDAHTYRDISVVLSIGPRFRCAL